jgi:HK97 gp10 family phage protein
MSKTKFYGFGELQDVLNVISKEWGVTDAKKNVLVPAARSAMKIVLEAAKRNLYPGHGLDTGQLQRTLSINARTVTGKDRRSKYVKSGDLIIAQVSSKLYKKYLDNPNPKTGKLTNVGDISDARAIAVEYGTKNKNKSVDITGLSKRSATALQRELGTVRMEARPYLRPALEKNHNEVAEKLRLELKNRIEKYRSKVS